MRTITIPVFFAIAALMTGCPSASDDDSSDDDDTSADDDSAGDDDTTSEPSFVFHAISSTEYSSRGIVVGDLEQAEEISYTPFGDYEYPYVSGLAYGDGALWAIATDTSSVAFLVKIDAATLLPVRDFQIPDGYGDGLTRYGSDLYAVQNDLFSNTMYIAKLDLDDDEMGMTVEEYAITGVDEPSAIASSAEMFWVTDHEEQQLVSISAITMQLLDRVDLPEPCPASFESMDYHDGHLWGVTNLEAYRNNVYQLTPDGELVAVHEIDSDHLGFFGFWFGEPGE